MVSSEITMMKAKKGITPRALNMILPIAAMVCMMPIMLILTGWESANTQSSFPARLMEAIGHGSGSASVLYSVIIALIASTVLYRVNGVMKSGELIDVAFKGIGG